MLFRFRVLIRLDVRTPQHEQGFGQPDLVAKPFRAIHRRAKRAYGILEAAKLTVNDAQVQLDANQMLRQSKRLGDLE